MVFSQHEGNFFLQRRQQVKDISLTSREDNLPLLSTPDRNELTTSRFLSSLVRMRVRMSEDSSPWKGKEGEMGRLLVSSLHCSLREELVSLPLVG
jgi:hypothetical protein